MVAAQEFCVGQMKQAFDDFRGIRPAVHVIADEDELSGRIALFDPIDQRVQRAKHAMNIADDPAHPKYIVQRFGNYAGKFLFCLSPEYRAEGCELSGSIFPNAKRLQ